MIYYNMVQILRKENFLVKLFLDKSQEKSQKMEFISFVFTEILEKGWIGLRDAIFLDFVL